MVGFLLKREFTDGELRLLIDGLLFSKHIPYSQCKDLVENLRAFPIFISNPESDILPTLPEDKTDNKQLFIILTYLMRQSIGTAKYPLNMWNI